MKSSRMTRSLAVVASAAMIFAAFAGTPAEAKKKKKKKAPVCSTFTPGEKGADKPTVVVKDSATEAAPAIQKVTLAPHFFEGAHSATPASYDQFNIQVDTAAKDTGLYALVEFPARRDVDLNMYHTDGSYSARSHGFQPVLGIHGTIDEEFGNLAGHGGESTDHSEKLVGIRTNDCGGWTLEVANYFGEGGELEVKLWLGEVQNDPQAPGAEMP